MQQSSSPMRRYFALGTALLAGLCAGGAWPQSDPGVVVNAPQILDFLNQTIDWYRQRAAESQLASETADQLLLAENRQAADQILRLAFEFARGAAALRPRQAAPHPEAGGTTAEAPSLLQLQARLDKEFQATQAELDADRQQLQGATGARRRALEGQILELPGEVDLLNARREAVRNMVEFLNGSSASGRGGSGLRSQIETLAATVGVGASAGRSLRARSRCSH